jgi:hypothetical protein
MVFTGDLWTVWTEPDLFNRNFLIVAVMSGIIGFSIR